MGTRETKLDIVGTAVIGSNWAALTLSRDYIVPLTAPAMRKHVSLSRGALGPALQKGLASEMHTLPSSYRGAHRTECTLFTAGNNIVTFRPSLDRVA